MAANHLQYTGIMVAKAHVVVVHADGMRPCL
jgi:hypothetical protein